jgi:hypothetical protein
MALTSAQRKRLPDSAFAYPKQRKYPIPTKNQARKAGISETQRQSMMGAAKAYSKRTTTMGTRGHIDSVIAKRRSR